MELKSILSYLRNKTILVTGATGFLAMVFVEKILRAQPDVKKIYLLIRDSGTKSATDRMYNEIIEKELFRVLREKYGTNFDSFISEKVAAVAGDVSFEDLVKELKLREEMYNEVEIIVNSAGTTNFDERYDIALAVNTFGVQHVMDFAKKCSKLEMLLHVSTAYICGVRAGLIPEDRSCMDEMAEKTAGLDFKLVEKNLAQEKLKELIAQDATKEEITAAMKDFGIERAKHHGWPNTYVFTKAMGELLLSKTDIPHVILRPTVVTSTYEEPFPGWIQGFRTIDSVIAFYGKGKLTCLLVDPFSVFDMIPVDMLVNSMIVAIVANANQTSKNIYHVGSSFRNPVTFFELHDYIFEYFTKKPWINKDGTPVKVRAGICFQTMTTFRMYMNIRYLFPLQGLRIVNKVFGQYFQEMYDQWNTKLTLAMRLVGLYEPYMTFKGIFDDTNTEDLRRIARESLKEAEDFKFDPKCINWDDYFTHTHIPGLQKHVMTKRR